MAVRTVAPSASTAVRSRPIVPPASPAGTMVPSAGSGCRHELMIELILLLLAGAPVGDPSVRIR